MSKECFILWQIFINYHILQIGTLNAKGGILIAKDGILIAKGGSLIAKGGSLIEKPYNSQMYDRN